MTRMALFCPGPYDLNVFQEELDPASSLPRQDPYKHE